MTSRRLYAPVVLATLATGGVAFFAASRAWASVDLAADGLPPDEVTVSGSSALPPVPALALVVVTAALAVLAASLRVRRAVGVLLVVVGVTGATLVATGAGSLRSAVRDAVEDSPAYTGGAVPDVGLWSTWSVAALLALALAAVLGVLVVRHAPAWPTMSSRYDAPRAREVGDGPVDDADLWKALDEGRDPTQ